LQRLHSFGEFVQRICGLSMNGKQLQRQFFVFLYQLFDAVGG
jgi:hypothetical protein